MHIGWGTNEYFLEVELRANGVSNFTSIGASQIVSVAYALFANEVADKDDADADPTNEIQTIQKYCNQEFGLLV